MNVPTMIFEKLVDEEGYLTKPWRSLFEQLLQSMQQSVSDEGYLIPSVSSASSSVDPPAAGGQVTQIEASYGQQEGAIKGTLIFDPAIVNGGVSEPNGQLKILLADGTFHLIPNL